MRLTDKKLEVLRTMAELEDQGYKIRTSSQISKAAGKHPGWASTILSYLAWEGYVERLESMIDDYWRWRLTDVGRVAAHKEAWYPWTTDSEVQP